MTTTSKYRKARTKMHEVAAKFYEQHQEKEFGLSEKQAAWLQGLYEQTLTNYDYMMAGKRGINTRHFDGIIPGTNLAWSVRIGKETGRGWMKITTLDDATLAERQSYYYGS